MVKLMVLYGAPADPAAFEERYAATHGPLVHKMPGLRLFEAGRVVGTPDGGEAPYYRVAELSFDSAEALREARSSPEGQETAADLANFASGGATPFIVDVD
jgi:uncharacterized protein (TIGR02118 family)